MSVSVTIWLELAFAALSVAAVALQAWLWGFPFDHEKHRVIDEAGWRKVVARMVEDNDAEIDAPSAQTIAPNLGATRGK